ncbi:NUDIX domain-containing protein [Streptomyces sp. SP17BM10]|uniref:NUDIX domain-containing protein n=1 Tax=Streptomyces sp. SP17BM10 TaxID=3002530 RepID=UPI002E7800BF|nr:NUDIX domain-containing protein [Streptomyces sp. SP17BM10]MEE1788347.1 NUDIX domain-containing protein [Streptomyces sp. SP17BM10]
MTERQPAPAEVEILAPAAIRLVETAAPDLTPEERRAMDRAWAEAVRTNPTFFDGPVAVCAGLRPDGPQDLELGWARTTYRQFVLRRVPGATGWLPALFVAVVQPADDGRVLVGRMAGPTAHPGRWGLPGGNVEPPTGDDLLDEPALQRHAARELLEETGGDTDPGALRRWTVVHTTNGNVGVLYLAPPRPAAALREDFEAMVADERSRGVEPEFDGMALVATPEEAAALAGPQVDYLHPVLRRYAEHDAENHVRNPAGNHAGRHRAPAAERLRR